MSEYNQAELAKDIERLVHFALKNEMIENLDAIVARNALLDLFKLDEPLKESFDAAEDEKTEESDDLELAADSPAPILARMLDYAAETGMISSNNTTQRDLLDARIMSVFMPRQSELARSFWQMAEEESIEKATDQFYHLSKCSNYIRMDRIAQNEYWTSTTDYGDLEITINLSKPEKDPAEIAALKDAPASNYPKCLLCLENVGYAGRINHPARQNHRVIPLKLEDESWYLQYSPYVYYNEHSIVFSKEHTPMKINDLSFRRLLSFVEQFPHYFIGSNADLPIVGGSILSHEHYQGGRHTFAMELAASEREYVHPNFPDVHISRVKWPMSVVRISSEHKEQLAAMASYLLDFWKSYSDPSVEILAYSDHSGEKIPHNTITPIARKNKQGLFEMDLVLRNNRTSEEHPDGIFHPHQPLHHIKKENIGLIEVMGLAVLPGRLTNELEQIVKILSGNTEQLGLARDEESHPLHKHVMWIDEMIDRYGMYLAEKEAWNCVHAEVGGKFADVLADAGVFKRDASGAAAFEHCMSKAGFGIK